MAERRYNRQRVLKFADALLEAGTDARTHRLVGWRFLVVGFLDGNRQRGDVLDLRAGSILCVDEGRVRVDLPEVEKFLDRAQSGRAVELLGGDLDQPIHPQFGHHRRFEPDVLVARNFVQRRDLCCRGPRGDLLKIYRAVDLIVFGFHEV